MTKQLSKSCGIMFIFDFVVLVFSTYFFYNLFDLDKKWLIVTIGLTTAAGLFSLFLKDNYKIREFNNTVKNAYLLFEGCIFANIPSAILLYTFINGENFHITSFVFANLLTTYILLKLYRIVFHYYLFHVKPIKNILIMGTNQNAKLIADEIINKKALKMNVVGFFEDIEHEEEKVNDKNVKVFPCNGNLGEIIQNENIDIVIVGIKRRMDEKFLTNMIINIPANVRVYKMPDFYEMVTGKYFIDRMSVNWLFYDYMNNRSLVYDFCKRAYDIIAALIILTVTLPILIYIGIRVKLTDGGDIIYTQKRVGKDGKTFNAYKLRTMYKNDYTPKNGVDEKSAGINDDRVIPFCKWVRKARFDEIPQMINIIKGEMSIVGPRTEWEDLVDIYSKEIPYYSCRQWVRTGWTGWAQINQGHCVSNEDITEKLSYDLYYLKHRNVLWEIGILIKAVFLALGLRHG